MANLIITVEGPPQSGKTRMVQELKNFLSGDHKVFIAGEESTKAGMKAAAKKFDLIIIEKTV